jgi:cell division initiation protein
VKITPLDVDQQQFHRVFRGCDPEEVHRFLDLVSREMEELIRENNQIKEELRRRDQQLVEYRQHETQLREALVSAGRMTDEIKESARKEAELITAEAELRAEKIIASAQERVVRLGEEANDLRLQKARLIAEVRSIVEGHARLLDTLEGLDREAAAAAPEVPRRLGTRG